MTRIIKRYGSRKLYDTQESRYVLLEDIAAWVRGGEEIQVVDNKTSEDVTSQTLIQVISEEGRKKRGFLSSDLLHDLIRTGEGAVNKRVKQFQSGVDRLVKKSFDRFNPMSHVRDEMDQLRDRLNQLETTLSEAELQSGDEPDKVEKTGAKKTPYPGSQNEAGDKLQG